MNQAGYQFSGELVTLLLEGVGRLTFVEDIILVDPGKITQERTFSLEMLAGASEVT